MNPFDRPEDGKFGRVVRLEAVLLEENEME